MLILHWTGGLWGRRGPSHIDSDFWAGTTGSTACVDLYFWTEDYEGATGPLFNFGRRITGSLACWFQTFVAGDYGEPRGPLHVDSTSGRATMGVPSHVDLIFEREAAGIEKAGQHHTSPPDLPILAFVIFDNFEKQTSRKRILKFFAFVTN